MATLFSRVEEVVAESLRPFWMLRVYWEGNGVSSEFAPKILDLFGRLFSEDLGGFRSRRGEGSSTIERGPPDVHVLEREKITRPKAQVKRVVGLCRLNFLRFIP
jgi:hypothetical protein